MDVSTSDFAISPDNSKMVVAARVVKKGEAGTWLVELNLADKKVIGKCRIPDPAALFLSFDHPTIQYSEDGDQIIFQSESALHSIDAHSMSVLYSISIPTTVQSASEKGSRRFIISSNGKTIGMFFGQSLFPKQNGEVMLFDAGTGNKLAEWRLDSQVQSFSLSPDGTQILMSALYPADAVDIFLMGSRSGKIIRTFESGFYDKDVTGERLNAIFLDGTHFAAVTDNEFTRNAKYMANPIKVFDTTTGKVSKTFAYKKLWPSPEDVWFSDRSGELAMLNGWESYWRRRFTEAGPRHSDLIFFKTEEPASVCVIGHLPEGTTKQSGFIRSSMDLKIIGLYLDDTIRLYKMPGCQ